ncbi:hypothetical protein [Sphingosinicella sp. LY1275]|nr:hypothetical protein [Sphingosinicella sp. LY1275]MEA1013714.1 hypothetical protein [Sphingosinicella sp. LY1275]
MGRFQSFASDERMAAFSGAGVEKLMVRFPPKSDNQGRLSDRT